jgi:hypothetical protein
VTLRSHYTLASWAVGITTYLLSLAAFYHQSISRGDLSAVLFWSLLASLVAFPIVYLPCMFLLRRLLRGRSSVLLFPVAASLLGIIPTFLILLSQGGRVRDLISHEAFLFYCMFIAVGVVFGLGFVWLYGRANTYQSDAANAG